MRIPSLDILRSCVCGFVVSGVMTTYATATTAPLSMSAEQIGKAWLFEQPLLWTGEKAPTENENLEITQIIESRHSCKPEELVQKFERFLADHPNSPWAASLHCNLGRYDRMHGYYTRALAHWETAWSFTKKSKSGNAKAIADYTLAHWTSLLGSLGRMDTLTALFDETADRVFESGPLQQIVNGTREGLHTMRTRPGGSFKCGTFALHGVARVLQGPAAKTKEIDQAPSPKEGFSMTRLVELSSQAGMNLVAARRPAGADLIVPCVVHWKQNHYAAIVASKGSLYRVTDPTFGPEKWVTREMIDEESSGNFLVPVDKLPITWEKLNSAETDHVYGRGAPNDVDDPDDSCPNGAGGASPPGSSSGGSGGQPGGTVGGVGSPFLPGDQEGGQSCGSCSGSNDDANDSDSPPPCCLPDESSDGSDGGDPLWAGPDGPSDPNVIVGMPFWSVSEPYINTWIYDRPLGYKPGLGPAVSLKLAYKQREKRSVSAHIFSCGDFWNFSWSSYILDGDGEVTLIAPGGGDRTYDSLDGTVPEYRTHSRMIRHTSGSDLSGFSVGFPNGATNEYNYIFTNGLDEVRAYLTTRSDRSGHKLIFQYEYDSTNDVHRLKYVVDGDSRTNCLYYTNALFPAQITSITDPFGRTTDLFYDTNGMLSSISDVAQISSSFKYDSQHWITNLITPYGTTLFTYTVNSVPPYDLGGEDTINRAVMIVDPASRTNLYMYRDNSDSIISEGYDTVNDPEYCDMLLDGMPEISTNYYDCPYGIPTLTDPDYYMNLRNSWHWGPRQFSNLSTSDMNSFTTTDYALGRLRHWLHKGTTSIDHVTHTLGAQRNPSPDGMIDGMTMVYDYDGGGGNVEGTNPYPRVVTYLLPETTEGGYRAFKYRWSRYDDLGHATNVVDNFSLAPTGGGIRRTNLYLYDSGGLDLVQVIGANDETLAGYAYNSQHQVIRATNAVGYVTAYTYDLQGRLTSVKTPAGLTTTNLYFSSGDYSNWIQTKIDIEISRTNSFTYANDLMLTHTDERGLSTTNTWDNLQRLTSWLFPDGTTISNIYDRLDRIRTIDRLGYQTSYGYDNARRITAITNALGNVTRYNYCTCGSLDSIQDALGHFMTFFYDNVGRRIVSVDQDGYAKTNYYNEVNRLTNIVDSSGISITNWYNYQGLLVTSSNSFGQMFYRVYDNEDRITNSVDQNGVTVTNAQDALGRVLIRGYPAVGAEEKFGYSTAGLVAYTNQLDNRTRYGYDAARRKIAETNANNEITQFSYSPAGDLTLLIDGNNHSTSWGYDIYGRVTSKTNDTPDRILAYSYDADGRLTNRWSLEKGNTVYKYDAVGNLTNVTYAVSPALTYSYDAANRLTSMTDSVGTTSFTYTDAGLLKSEDGPWDDDTVSYTYTGRRRQQLSLLQPHATPWTQTYGYDSANRISTISSPAGMFTYSYDPGQNGYETSSALVNGLVFPNGARETNSFDSQGRVTERDLLNGSSSNLYQEHIESYSLADEKMEVYSTWRHQSFTYDAIGRLVADSATDPFDDAAPRVNERLKFSYDAAGNLKYRTNNTVVENFQVNNLNELAAVTNGGRLTVVGTSTSVATSVTVNGTNADLYSSDATFAATNMPRVSSYTAIAQDSKGRHDTNVVNVNISTNVMFSYDGNGNMLSDGLHSYEWNDENELIAIFVTNTWRGEFTYDAKLRRRIEKDFQWNGSSWAQTNETRFVYDGNLIVQHRNGYNYPVITLTRGKDLSGSLEGAGGIGGLLAFSEMSNPQILNSYFHSDANGNVTMLINYSQSMVAKYLYDAFGNILSISGPKAFLNPYRFSSKPLHGLSATYDYLYRSYNPGVFRWSNRDPLEDGGSLVYAVQGFGPDDIQDLRQLQSEDIEGANLFAFVDNNPNEFWDAFGTDKGGKPVMGGNKNVSCEGFTTKSCPKDVKKALDAARAARNTRRAKALAALWKVMRRSNLFFFFLDFLELEMRCDSSNEA